jgi:murein L,D-transpeptidase YafK
MKHYLITLLMVVFTVSFTVTAQAENFLLSSVQADYILVEKVARRLTLFVNNRKIKTYKIALGRNPIGPKLEKGDMRTPEGLYYIDARNPESKYHMSLHLSYPNEVDLEIAALASVSPGGNIMIHGAGEEYAWMGKFHVVHDWTEGCIAVTNDEIEEIWNIVPDGTIIEIRP